MALKERDKIHLTLNTIDGYNKTFNYVACCRDAGKTTAWTLDKAYKNFVKYKQTTLIVNRKIADISDTYIDTIQSEINEFEDESIKIEYKTSDFKNGIVPLFINGKKFALMIALSVDITRLKKIKLENIGVIVFDEFIVNPKYGEKYLHSEVEKFKDVYTTFSRKYKGKGRLKCYFFGNPYTRYNPYFVECGVDIDKILPNTIIQGDNYVIQSYQICDELVKILKQKNPYYDRDDAYKQYALNGVAVNDAGIKIEKKINNYKLFLVCRVGQKQIGIFKNNDVTAENRYNCRPITVNNVARDVYCFNVDDLLNDNNVLFSPSDANKFVNFRLAYRRNKVTYSDIATYYDVKEIYNYI